MSSRRAITIESLEPRRLLHVGDIDPAFNDGKTLTEDYHHGGSTAEFITPLADGGFYVLGSEGNSNGYATGVAVTKYTFDGHPDSSFGKGGSLVLQPTDYWHVYGLFPTSDGGFIVDGGFGPGGHPELEKLIVKYTPNGQIDTSFGKSGILQTGELIDQYDEIGDLKIDSAGRILVSGCVGNTGVLRRYLPNGQLDATFATKGEFDVTPPAAPKAKEFYSEFISSVVFDSQDRLYVSCTQVVNKQATDFSSPLSSETLLDRLSSSGTLDSSFAATGTADLFDSFGNYFHATNILPNGAIITTDGENFAELNADGSFNQTYGQGGYSGVSISDGYVVASDGSIIVALDSHPDNFVGPATFFIRRIKPNGTLDRSFGSNGKIPITTAIDGEFTGLDTSAVAFAADGTLIAAANEGMLTPSGLTDTRAITLARVFVSDDPAVHLISRTYKSKAKPLKFDVLIRAADGVDASSLGSQNLRLFDADGNSSSVHFLASQDVLGDDDLRYIRATYRIGSATGAGSIGNGDYEMRLMRRQISGTGHAYASAQTLGPMHIRFTR